jgi:acetyl esterase/lipase
VPGDVLAPANARDLPTIVLLPGGGTQFADRRVHQGRLAADLATRGAVVFLMAYRSAVTGNYDSAGANDVRCAVRYARFATADHGGDPDRVIVVGHSQGGLHALEVALAPDEDAEACLADGSGRPDAVIGLGAPLPRTAASADEGALPIWLFAGDEDGDAEGDAARLEERGFDADARELPGVTHGEITDSAATPEIVDLIFEAVDSLQRP